MKDLASLPRASERISRVLRNMRALHPPPRDGLRLIVTRNAHVSREQRYVDFRRNYGSVARRLFPGRKIRAVGPGYFPPGTFLSSSLQPKKQKNSSRIFRRPENSGEKRYVTTFPQCGRAPQPRPFSNSDDASLSRGTVSRARGCSLRRAFDREKNFENASVDREN